MARQLNKLTQLKVKAIKEKGMYHDGGGLYPIYRIGHRMRYAGYQRAAVLQRAPCAPMMTKYYLMLCVQS